MIMEELDLYSKSELEWDNLIQFSKNVDNFNFDAMTTMWLLEIFLNNPVELLQETFPADVMRTKSNQLLQSHENFRAAK